MSTPPLAKALAANDKATRDKAVEQLRAFLHSSKSPSMELSEAEIEAQDEPWEDDIDLDGRFGDLELAKLWKALFYCFWMSDKPLVQQDLASTLANLALYVRPKNSTSQAARVKCALKFIAAFWASLLREWSGIDRFRIDKYLMLARRYCEVSIRLLQRERWRVNALDTFQRLLLDGPLNTSSHKTPLAIPLHLSEILLATVGPQITAAPIAGSAESEAPILPLRCLIQPYLITIQACDASRKPLATSIENDILKPLLETALPQRQSKKRRFTQDAHLINQDAERIIDNFRLCDLENNIVDKETFGRTLRQDIFDLASQTKTSDPCRRRLYELCRTFDLEQ